MQKKYILLLLGLCCSLSVFAAQNTISMVSYFPLPYASYKNMRITQKLDVGLGDKCSFAAGKTNASYCPLTATTANLKGDLNLASVTTFISTGAATIGSTSDQESTLIFKHNLRINDTLGSDSTPIHSLNAGTLYVGSSSGLHLFKDAVTNDSAVMSECTDGAHWQKIGNYIYLVCGSSTPASCSPSRTAFYGLVDTCDGNKSQRWSGISSSDKECRDRYEIEPLAFGKISQCTASCKDINDPNCDECSSASDCSTAFGSGDWKCACYNSRRTCLLGLSTNITDNLETANGVYYRPAIYLGSIGYKEIHVDKVKACANNNALGSATYTKHRCLTNLGYCRHTGRDYNAQNPKSDQAVEFICNRTSPQVSHQGFSTDVDDVFPNRGTVPNGCSFGEDCLTCDTSKVYSVYDISPKPSDWNPKYRLKHATILDGVAPLGAEEQLGDDNPIVYSFKGYDCFALPTAKCVDVDSNIPCSSIIEANDCSSWNANFDADISAD